MNRPLKFRVFSHADKIFHYWNIQEDPPSGIYGGISYPDEFTGFTDIQGRDIYENDRILVTRRNYDGDAYDSVTGVVRWVNSGFLVKAELTNGLRDEEYLNQPWFTYEIVGNTHT